MIVRWSTYKDFYRNPTVEDFKSNNVWVRRNHLSAIIQDWNDWDENDFGVINWTDREHFQVVMEPRNSPNIVKITTQDGTDWYFYKLEQPAIVSESDKTVSTIIYELNKWDTYLWEKFFQLNSINPVVETLNLHSDIIIFYWSLGRILDLGITSFVATSDSIDDIRASFNWFIKASNEDWETGDINKYYDLEIVDGKVRITPKTVNDKSYFTTNTSSGTDLGYIELDYTVGTPNQRVDILYFKLNILEQKQFSDTMLNDNFQLVRKYIGTKTPSQLYSYNGISQTNTINFNSYADDSKTHTITLQDLDNISFDNTKNVYKQIGCKASAVKKFNIEDGKITGIESMGGQYQLFIPIGNREIALFDKIGDWLEPTPTSNDSTENPEPKPEKVQIAPFAAGSKLTDATLSDIPNGLYSYLAIQQIGATGEFANLGSSLGTYDWDNDKSIPYIKIPTNRAVKIKISELAEQNSLEYKIKKIFTNISNGIYDADTEPLFLNPKYFYEAVVYDNTNFIKIDTSWINYEILANEILADGLVLEANIAITNNFCMWYTFSSNSGNGKIGNNELNTDWNITKTNLWVENNRTTLELGSNAENLANGGALAAQVGYLNNKTTIDVAARNNTYSQIGNAFSVINDAIAGAVNVAFLGASKPQKTLGAITGGISDVMGMFQQQTNFKDGILKMNRSYNASISQIKSANATDASLPYTTSFGNQDGLFTRCSYEIQEWNKKSKFLEINKSGYIYRDSNYFQVWDNRLYWNSIRISSNQNYHYIVKALQNLSAPEFSAYQYCEELLIWLMGGITICNLNYLPDFNTLQNLPKVLPPNINSQKKDWTKFFNIEELSRIGLIGDNTMSWDVNGLLRTRIITVLQNHSNNTPSDLLSDLNTANFGFNYTQTSLEIICYSSDNNYYGRLVLSNIFVINKDDYISRIGSFIINDYQNNKEYFDLHIKYQLGDLSKSDGNWDSVDYSFSGYVTKHLNIIIKNTFININVLEYNLTNTSHSIGIDTLFNSKNNSFSYGNSAYTINYCGILRYFENKTGDTGISGELDLKMLDTTNNLTLNFFAYTYGVYGAYIIGKILILQTGITFDLINRTVKIQNEYNGGGYNGNTDTNTHHWTLGNVNINPNSGRIDYNHPNNSSVGNERFNNTYNMNYDELDKYITFNTDKLNFKLNKNSLFSKFNCWLNNQYTIDATANSNNIVFTIETVNDSSDNINVTFDNWTLTSGLTISNNTNSFTFSFSKE